MFEMEEEDLRYRRCRYYMPICPTPDTPRPPSAASPPSPIALLPMQRSTRRRHGERASASQWCLAADALSSSVVVTNVTSSHIIIVIDIMQQSTPLRIATVPYTHPTLPTKKEV